MKAILYPLDKVVLDDKEIRLGMKKGDVEAVFGQGETYDESRYYYYDELAIDYSSEDNTVEYIEILGGPDGEIQPEIYGVKAFQVDADVLLKVLSEQNGADIDDSEEDSKAFRKISVGIYRENYEDRWETIGLGVKGYYRE
ncbi:MAG: hypothetical protein ILP19_06275 [Oscillospiraceae bacterium]|nr:hypothetical protein [Oscillospiraceae bacterium]